VTPSDPRREDDRALGLALFRYGVIAELVERDDFAPGERTDRVRRIVSETHYQPGHGPRHISERTVYNWLAAYRREGLGGLLPRFRRDRGALRALDEDSLARAIQLRKEQPKRWTSTLLDILVLEGKLEDGARPHRATLDRHLRKRGASRRQLKTLGARRHTTLVFDHFGDLWVGDYHHGPLVLDNRGQPTTAKLGAFLDHCTRWPVSDRYYLAEDIASLRDTMLRALLAWGPPKVVYVDRGSVYRAEQLAWSLDRLEPRCRLVHSKAYYSEGRGVIERWWQCANAFEDEVRVREELLTLHQLNRLWEAWRARRYCEVPHSELGCSPVQAIAEVVPKPIDPEVAAELFLVRATRSVHKKDCCVAVDGRRYRCDASLRGEQVQVRYDPRDRRSVLVFTLDGQRLQRALPKPVNVPEPHARAPARLEQSVDYLALLRDDFDRKLLEHARPLAYADLPPDEGFSLDDFVRVVADLAGLQLRDAQRQELAAFWSTFGPIPESLVRIAVEHAVRLHTRNRHVRVYLHAIRTLVLAHLNAPPEPS
jgi:transposase